MGPYFQNVQTFGCLPSKISNILKNTPIFRVQSLETNTSTMLMTAEKFYLNQWLLKEMWQKWWIEGEKMYPIPTFDLMHYTYFVNRCRDRHWAKWTSIKIKTQAVMLDRMRERKRVKKIQIQRNRINYNL